ncbi:MAG: HD domain-containing protein [Firmicutes bacterium]|jgi:HD-GYP domain-containing protein (c-di-GMP phosphodiesterase class II)|nr:HD domain-containing protein [Bacillota bacterium]
MLLWRTFPLSESGELHMTPNLSILDACSAANIDIMLEGMANLIAAAIDRNIPNQGTHSQRVAALAASIAKKLGLPQEEIKRIYMAGLFHDFGKLFLPSRVLIKTEPLSDDDWSFIKLHPQLGSTFLERIPAFQNIAMDVLHHHERIDGLGYPRQLSGEDIPLGSRVIAVAGAYDTMTTINPYRTKVEKDIACEILIKDSGTHFDGGVVQAFLATLGYKKIGA